MPGETLFDRLKGACAAEWEAYTRHEFVRRLGAGTLQEPAFRHYLQQDYLFLIHFARAYALAGYKADTLEDLRAAAATMAALVDTEMSLHVAYCREWGLSEAEMAAAPEDRPTIAYTRFVLERGMAGDLLDLHVALVPCIVGYAEIGRWLANDPETLRADNPYAAWIEMYSGPEYQDVADGAVATLDRLMARRGGEGRFGALLDTFRMATVLEADFWRMGLDHAANC
jgi:thiaminase/transcriptional activator TenA